MIRLHASLSSHQLLQLSLLFYFFGYFPPPPQNIARDLPLSKSNKNRRRKGKAALAQKLCGKAMEVRVGRSGEQVFGVALSATQVNIPAFVLQAIECLSREEGLELSPLLMHVVILI